MATTVKGRTSAQVAGVELTNPERVLYPKQKVSKRQLAEYYQSIADYILPYVTNRPLTLLRCPQGRTSECFYQRHLNGEALAGIGAVRLANADGEERSHILIHDLTGLISLAQLGTLELHPWNARADDPEHPDHIVFDLDPGKATPWSTVIHAARWLHGRLATLDLRSFVCTTGGAGLHVVVPIAPKHDWDTIKAFSRSIAAELADHDPLRYTITPGKAARTGKVFIDYLRNTRGASSIASYSPRAHAGAPVATPLNWSILSEIVGSDAFNINSIQSRMNVLREDPWVDFFSLNQPLTDDMLAEAFRTD